MKTLLCIVLPAVKVPQDFWCPPTVLKHPTRDGKSSRPEYFTQVQLKLLVWKCTLLMYESRVREVPADVGVWGAPWTGRHSLESPINLRVFRLWEEAGGSGENPR